jgi:hypothetical protein
MRTYDHEHWASANLKSQSIKCAFERAIYGSVYSVNEIASARWMSAIRALRLCHFHQMLATSLLRHTPFLNDPRLQQP